MRIRILFLFTIFSVLSFAQEKVQDSITRKKITAVKLEKAPKIDGNLDDDAWKNIPIAKDFIEFRPNNGKAEDADFKSEVKIAYDEPESMSLLCYMTKNLLKFLKNLPKEII